MIISIKCFQIHGMELKDKNVIITGGNSGIGYYTALDLAKRDAVVTILGRDEKTCQSSVETIITESQNQNVSFYNEFVYYSR